jgi:predicted alpha/beta-hydrolase family hydrolase
MHQPSMPAQVKVAISSHQSVTAVLYRAAPEHEASVTLILAPGAGAGQKSAFIVSFASGMAARGIDTVTFDFLYREEGRRLPDPNDRLEACWRAVIAAIRPHQAIGSGALAIGGKSMGGRIASQVAASGIGDLAGLVFLGYPLHPPGRPDRLRARHLSDITAPMLFVQGSRDAFGTPDELRPIITPLNAKTDLYVVEGGDHSFKVPKRSGVSPEDVGRTIQDHVSEWLKGVAAVRTAR